VNENTGELASEYNMLNEMRGKSCCQVYAYDATKGLLMEERIIPGTVLRNEKNAAVRIECFHTVFKDIHKKINIVQSYPTYLDWLRNAEQFCMNHDLDESVLHHMHIARIYSSDC
jgi:streptomycin 6-kinase